MACTGLAVLYFFTSRIVLFQFLNTRGFFLLLLFVYGKAYLHSFSLTMSAIFNWIIPHNNLLLWHILKNAFIYFALPMYYGVFFSFSFVLFSHYRHLFIEVFHCSVGSYTRTSDNTNFFGAGYILMISGRGKRYIQKVDIIYSIFNWQINHWTFKCSRNHQTVIY